VAAARFSLFGFSPGENMEPATALLVDQDPTAVDLLRTALAGEALAFDVAYDFATAIRCLDSGRYCGVIVDLALPRGLELLGRTSLPMVVIANGSIPVSLREHIKFVLPKPVKTSLLLNVIRGLCSLASAKEVGQPRRERRAASPEELRDADRLRGRP
jgi:DNA-binding NtrC family response regulator